MGSIAAVCAICNENGFGSSISFPRPFSKHNTNLPADALANANILWFCEKHLPIALKYRDLPKNKALEKILKEIHK